MKLLNIFYLLSVILCSTTLAQTEPQSGERFDEDLPDPILSTEKWKKLKPGKVYQGYLKLNTDWSNNWPLVWQLKGDNLKLHKLHDGWMRKNYFRTQKSRIHDPQGYLTNIQKDVLADILKNHEKVSQLPIHLFIFGAGQQFVSMDAQKAGEEFLKKPNSTLMYYFMGDSKATTGYVKTKTPPKIPGSSEKDEDVKPLLDPFLVKTMFTKAGTHAATQNQDPSETLYATVAEVSRRMYWIEQELGLVTPSENTLDDTSKEDEVEEDEPSMIDKLWEQLGGNKQNLLYLGSGILIALLFIVSAFILMIYRRLKVYQFPSYSDSTRLAAEYGAGVSEVVAFKDARVSLSDQKKRIEDSEI